MSWRSNVFHDSRDAFSSRLIRGFFSETHPLSTDPAVTMVPLLDALLYVPAIDAHITLQFLVDTGADLTVIHPYDSLRLAGADERNDRWRIIREFPSERFGGAGRDLPYFGVPAVLGFTDEDGTIDQLPIRVWIAEPLPTLQEHESLLGRDVFAQFDLSFSQGKHLVLTRTR